MTEQINRVADALNRCGMNAEIADGKSIRLTAGNGLPVSIEQVDDWTYVVGDEALVHTKEVLGFDQLLDDLLSMIKVVTNVSKTTVDSGDRNKQVMGAEALQRLALNVQREYLILEQQTKGYKHRFLSFLKTYQPTDLCAFSNLVYTRNAFRYDPVLSAGEEGLAFSVFGETQEGDVKAFFVVPFEYLKDPEKWESDILFKMGIDMDKTENSKKGKNAKAKRR